MSTAHRRPKAPEEVRARLIKATARLLNAGEVPSLNAVAQEAQVTKGAVQHHFGSGDGLRAALYDACIASFESLMAPTRADATATEAAAYVQATMAPDGQALVPLSRAMLAAMMADRKLAARWSAWIADSRAAGPESTAQLVARLAMDGLWLSDILGLYQLDDTQREHLQAAVLRLAEGNAE